MLQQQGQIPNGPLPKIVLDYNVNNIQPQAQQPQVQQPQVQQPQVQQLPKINEEGEESEIIDEINYENSVKTANSMNGNQYQKIEDDELDDDLINQKLTKAEIEKINNKILNK